MTMSIQTRMTVVVTALTLAVSPAAGGSVTTVPSADRIAFTAMGFPRGSVFTVNSDGSGLRRLAANANSAVWSPDRKLLVFQRRVRVGENFRGDPIYRSDLYTVRPDGSGSRLLVRGGDLATWSPDSQSIAFLRRFRLWRIGVDGSGERQLVKADAEDLAWSPTGEWIAFMGCTSRCEVWLVHPDGTGLRRLVRTGPQGVSPAWSPDGRRVSFLGSFDDDGMYVVGVDGRGLRRVTRADDSNQWSPDGRWIMFERGYLEENNGLWLTGPEGGTAKRLALRVSDSDWSPEGRNIAFIRNERIYVMSSDGTQLVRVTTGIPKVGGLDW